MTQEDKELLLKDLCARLPYQPQINIEFENMYGGGNMDSTLLKIDAEHYLINDEPIGNVRPYLRPMSSMTEEEFVEYYNIKYDKVTSRDKWERIDVGKYHNVGIIPIDEYLDWLNAHHFDYRGLIEKGLAIEAPEGMYS